jgi:hypothetical protein
MKCNCIFDIEKKVFETVSTNGRFKKPVLKVKLEGVGFFVVGNTMVGRTVNMLSIELEGQKKLEKMTMAHSFCPFCGIKLGEQA